MKKSVKIALGILIALICVVFVFIGSIIYVSEYKASQVDSAVSPDKTYELNLLAIGEPDWPFGAAKGRLELVSGKNTIVKYEFSIQNDGAPIWSSSWDVVWYDDYVEVILSGSEQYDEQVIIKYTGEIESRQLTDSE